MTIPANPKACAKYDCRAYDGNGSIVCQTCDYLWFEHAEFDDHSDVQERREEEQRAEQRREDEVERKKREQREREERRRRL